MPTEETRFPLHDLIEDLPPQRRHLLLDVRDPASLAREMPITGARALELARETELVFCKAETPALIQAIVSSRSRFIVARPEIMPLLPAGFAEQRVLILTHKPRLLLAALLLPFETPPAIAQQKESIHQKARIAPDVMLGPGVVIGADVEIGPRCIVGPNTVIDHATIQEDTRIAFNCSIGYDGFGFEVDEETGEVIRFPHLGRVQIGRRVEIYPNTSIERGSLRDTILEDDVKVDNLVLIGHNCLIKHGTILTANSVIAGSSTVGEYSWIAPTTSVMNGITVGRCVMTGLGAVVTRSVGDNELVVGVPARKLRDRFPSDFPLLKR